MVTFVPAVVRNGISESAPAVLYQAFEEPTHSRLSPDRTCLRPVLLTAACDASKLVNSYGIRISPAAAARTHRMEMTHEGRREPPFFSSTHHSHTNKAAVPPLAVS